MVNHQPAIVTDIEITATSLKAYCRLEDPVAILSYGLEQYQEGKKNKDFKNEFHALDERIAYGQQCLTRKGRLFLYPELTKFLDEQDQQCRPKKLGLARTEL
jgi:hypothetical protein